MSIRALPASAPLSLAPDILLVLSAAVQSVSPTTATLTWLVRHPTTSGAPPLLLATGSVDAREALASTRDDTLRRGPRGRTRGTAALRRSRRRLIARTSSGVRAAVFPSMAPRVVILRDLRSSTPYPLPFGNPCARWRRQHACVRSHRLPSTVSCHSSMTTELRDVSWVKLHLLDKCPCELGDCVRKCRWGFTLRC